MKFSQILALGALAPAAAFNIQAPKVRSMALNSAPPATGGDGPMAKVCTIGDSNLLTFFFHSVQLNTICLLVQ